METIELSFDRLGGLLNLSSLDGSLSSELSGRLLSDGDDGGGGRDLSLDGEGGLGLSDGGVGVGGGDSKGRESGGLERRRGLEQAPEMEGVERTSPTFPAAAASSPLTCRATMGRTEAVMTESAAATAAACWSRTSAAGGGTAERKDRVNMGTIVEEREESSRRYGDAGSRGENGTNLGEKGERRHTKQRRAKR